MFIFIFVLCLMLWAAIILFTPKNTPVTVGSKNAIDNIYYWFNANLGPNWPFVLSLIIILLIIILVLSVNSLSSVNINDKYESIIIKFLALITIGIAALHTRQWRSNQPTIQFIFILVLLCMNIYVLLCHC